MEVLRPFQYWTLWVSKKHAVTLHHVITLSNDLFDHIDVIVWAFTRKKTLWNEDLFFAVKSPQQKLSNYYAEVTQSTGMLLISANILDPFWMLQSLRNLDKGMDINSGDETSYTTQYQQALLKYVENQYCAKHRCVPVKTPGRVLRSNLVPFTTASGSDQSSFDAYCLSSDDEKYLMPNNVAEMTSGWSDHAARLLTVASLYLNSSPEAPKNWGQIDPNLNYYNSDPMEISTSFWIPDITDCWRQKEATHWKYPDHSNVAPDLVLATGPCIQPAVRVRTTKTVQFASRPVQNPDPPGLGWSNTDPYASTGGFCQVWLDSSVPISGSVIQVFHLWSHLDILLLIAKYWLR